MRWVGEAGSRVRRGRRDPPLGPHPSDLARAPEPAPKGRGAGAAADALGGAADTVRARGRAGTIRPEGMTAQIGRGGGSNSASPRRGRPRSISSAGSRVGTIAAPSPFRHDRAHPLRGADALPAGDAPEERCAVEPGEAPLVHRGQVGVDDAVRRGGPDGPAGPGGPASPRWCGGSRPAGTRSGIVRRRGRCGWRDPRPPPRVRSRGCPEPSRRGARGGRRHPVRPSDGRGRRDAQPDGVLRRPRRDRGARRLGGCGKGACVLRDMPPLGRQDRRFVRSIRRATEGASPACRGTRPWPRWRAGPDPQVIGALREGRPIADSAPAVASPRRVGDAHPGPAEAGAFEALLAARFTAAQVPDVILTVSVETISNRVAGTPLDGFVGSAAWVTPSRRAIAAGCGPPGPPTRSRRESRIRDRALRAIGFHTGTRSQTLPGPAAAMRGWAAMRAASWPHSVSWPDASPRSSQLAPGRRRSSRERSRTAIAGGRPSVAIRGRLPPAPGRRASRAS